MIDSSTLDDESILRWFESADLAQCIVTHSMASGIIRMRQKGTEGRKRRSDNGVPRNKRKADGQAEILPGLVAGKHGAEFK